MRRHALIISNPGESGAENYCKGVEVDVKNYTAFLKSPLGGGWYASEITHLNRPSCAELENKISSLSFFDYTFIVFCGHGFYSARQESTILELRKNEEFNSLGLRKNSNKRTIVLDCCRKVEKDLIEKAMMEAKFAEIRTELNLSECRKYFEEQIKKCSNAVIVGYACSKDETAGDSESKGGYYSYSLLNTATHWHESTHIDQSQNWRAFSVVLAHRGAAEGVRSLSGSSQNPEIEKPRSEEYFPFAIMA